MSSHSPVSSIVKSATCSSSMNASNIQDIPRIGVELIEKIEAEAIKVSTDVDKLISDVTKSLSTISAISVANIQTQNDSLNELSNTINSAVHNMFYLISHCEELDKNMEPVIKLTKKVDKLKSLLSALEENVLAIS